MLRCGVDLIETYDGYTVLEVNTGGEFHGLMTTATPRGSCTASSSSPMNRPSLDRSNSGTAHRA